MIRKFLFVVLVSLVFSMAVFAQGASTTAAEGEKPKKSAVFRPTKDQIKQVQTILKAKGIYSGDASGTYNDETRAAIKSFQESKGLKETGTLNRATLEKFGVELTESQKLIPVSESSYASAETEKPARIEKTASTSSTADKPKKAAPFRATKDQVIEAQKLLKSKSMYAGEETGKLDDATREGLKKFQEKSEIKVTGTLNAVTLEKMGIALTDGQKAAATASTSTPK